MIEPRYLAVLRDISFMLAQLPVNWVITGSVALRSMARPSSAMTLICKSMRRVPMR